MKPRDLITKAREQAQRRSLSLATRDLLNGLCDALEKAETELDRLTEAPRWIPVTEEKLTIAPCAADRGNNQNPPL